jgi:uncharacterized membrane protein
VWTELDLLISIAYSADDDRLRCIMVHRIMSRLVWKYDLSPCLFLARPLTHLWTRLFNHKSRLGRSTTSLKPHFFFVVLVSHKFVSSWFRFFQLVFLFTIFLSSTQAIFTRTTLTATGTTTPFFRGP